MGEEIIMSTRLWTHGYDIFSPSQAVVGHIYVRRHKPKFWESVHRAFTPGVHNPLQVRMFVIHLLIWYHPLSVLCFSSSAIATL